MSGYNDKNILYGGPLPPLIETRSLGDLVLKILGEKGNDVMFIDANNGVKMTKDQVRRHVIRLVNSLKTFNVKEGDVIGICSENCLEYPILAYATFCLGATIAPLNVTYTIRELDHTVNLSRPRLVFVSSTSVANVTKVAEKNRFIQKIIHLNGENAGEYSNELVTTYAKLVSDHSIDSSKEVHCEAVDIRNNVAMIFCSSGTTGLPKGVEITQHNMMVLLSMFYYDFQKGVQSLDRRCNILTLPCSHSLGFMTLVAASLCGDKVVILRKFEPRLFLKTIEVYKPKVAVLIPPLILFLAKSPLVDEYDLSSLKSISSGAAPLSKNIIDSVIKRLKLFKLSQGYGLSEVTLGVLKQIPGFDKPGSVGALRPGIWGKIIDPETGKTLGPYKRGEVCIKGSLVMRGYVRNEAATKEIIDADGWLHTGDIGYYDKDREWFIVDRLKELIKYKGNQVAPVELEAQLLTHPDIIDAAVIGIPDESAGELPMAFVVRKPESSLTEKKVVDFIAETASPAKRLHGGVKFIDEIPKNSNGKILRRILRDRVSNTPKSKL